MGMYTGLRFKGVVKPEFRDGFEQIALDGEWDSFEQFKILAQDDRSSFIPMGALSYMPLEWDNDGEFERSWNSDTGEWIFQCSLKNYDDTIRKFIDLCPKFLESVEHCEYFYEESDRSTFYDLEDNKMIMSNRSIIY